MTETSDFEAERRAERQKLRDEDEDRDPSPPVGAYGGPAEAERLRQWHRPERSGS